MWNFIQVIVVVIFLGVPAIVFTMPSMYQGASARLEVSPWIDWRNYPPAFFVAMSWSIRIVLLGFVLGVAFMPLIRSPEATPLIGAGLGLVMATAVSCHRRQSCGRIGVVPFGALARVTVPSGDELVLVTVSGATATLYGRPRRSPMCLARPLAHLSGVNGAGFELVCNNGQSVLVEGPFQSIRACFGQIDEKGLGSASVSFHPSFQHVGNGTI